MYTMNNFLLCVLFLAASGASQEVTNDEAIPLESLKDALRQVFRIPDKAPSSNHRPSGRSLRFMMQLYKKITSGESQFPKEANTVRSIAPVEDSEEKHSLLFNLTTSQDERIISSYLHITGHRRPTHPSRIAFYLDPPAKKGDQTPEPKEFTDEPMMVVFVKKQPLDIDASRITKKALEYSPPLLIRIKEEQLRRGKWVTSPTRRLAKKSPILIVVSADPNILDLEAFGVGALRTGKTHRTKENVLDKSGRLNRHKELSIHEKVAPFNEGSRAKRSLTGKNSFEFYGNDYPHEERSHNLITKTEIKPHGKSPKDTYWIQRESLKPANEEDETSFLNEFDSNYKIDFDGLSPLSTNSFGKGVDSYENKASKNFTKFKENSELRNSLKKDENHLNDEKSNYFMNVLTTPHSELIKKQPKKSKLESRVTNQPGEEDDQHLMLLPLQDYKPLPKSERKRLKKKNKNKSDLIPYPEYYASWDNWDWDYQESPKWKRKARKGKKNKDKERKSKGISDKWINIGMQNRLSNVASIPVSTPVTGKCQKRSFYVDFKILGWANNLILAPPGFETYFCSGVCPTPLSMAEAGSNHAIIQSILRASNAAPDLPDPCCVPARLDSLTILTLEEDSRVILRTLPNMVVKSCSCQ